MATIRIASKPVKKIEITALLFLMQDALVSLNMSDETPLHKIAPLWPTFTYFPHQLDGIRWMLDKERNGTSVLDREGGYKTVYGGFQCDDMGLGKTVQIVSTMINHPLMKTLLIAPLAMLDTWATMCMKAGIFVYMIGPSGWELKKQDGPVMRRKPLKTKIAVYISNYEKLYRVPSYYRQQWDRVVLDEAHKIRNGSGEVARVSRLIQAPIRWAVTGTPLVNSLKDVVSLLAFIGVPYSPLFTWEPRYRTMMPYLLIHRSLDSLRSVIKGAPPVPEIHELVLPFVSEAEEEFYEGVQCGNASKNSSTSQENDKKTEKADALLKKYQNEQLSSIETFKLLLRLRQLSVHPQVYIHAKRRENSAYGRDDWIGPSTKMAKIKDIMLMDLEDIAQDPVRVTILPNEDDGVVDVSIKVNTCHKYIIFCQFHDEMALLREFLITEGLAADEHILLYHGGLTQSERSAVLQRSRASDETSVMLLQLQAGGVGLNLQEYDRIIFMSPWWTSALMDQAIARAVRMGQTRVVKIYHLNLAVEKDSLLNIDRLINDKAEQKRKMLMNLFAQCCTF
jgi:SNF2 family DNA or RNA helicase